MTPEQIAYLLILGCPHCGRDLTVEDLCDHDGPDDVPLCRGTCCPLEHHLYKAWEHVA